MILTEEEAKTKRCQESFGPTPVATIAAMPLSPGNYQINPPMYPVMPVNCIGSACMAWRWFGWRVDCPDGSKTTHPIKDEPQNLREGYEATHVGHCGKAGRP